MSVKAVNDIEHLGKFRCLYRQIRSASAADDHNINFIFPLLYIVYAADFCSLCQNLYVFRCSSGKYSFQFHIRILFNGALHASSKVSIANNSNTYTHLGLLLFYDFMIFYALLRSHRLL